ncbi:MAG: ribosome maturation factor RimM [Pseudomonadota bacterium]
MCVAAIAAAHGIRGALRIKSFTEVPEDVAAYGPVFDQEGQRLFSLDVIGPTKGGVIAKVEGIDDRDAAEALRGTKLFIPREALPEPNEEDEFYYSDLEGLHAFQSGGARVGTVKRVVNHGAGDLLEIIDDRGKLNLVPFDKASVPVIDIENGRLEVTPRPELVADEST